MKLRGNLLLSAALGALVLPLAGVPGASAADVVPVKAAPVESGWWYNAYVEVGGRFFLNNPQRNGIKSQGGDSLAKFYEYRDLRPGPFGAFDVSAGSKDGLYQIDAWGKNLGYDDQSYYLGASKAGEQYFNFGWDQTPHVYSTSALTLYNGVGTNALTLPAGVGTGLYNCALGNPAGSCNGALAPAANTLAPANAASVQTFLNQHLYQTDLGIRRDTAAVEYRWTPTDAWDIRVNYMNMRRTGTQVDGMVMGWSTQGVVAQVPKPIADTTQNYGASGEYAGTSLWGKKFNIKVAYGGSTYSNDYASYTVVNPFCQDGGTCLNFPNSRYGEQLNLVSLAPSNQANAMTTTLGADLPLNSRYVNTTSYTMMRQNQQFLPFTINGLGSLLNAASWTGAAAPNSTASLPAQSLNGEINTLLVNNVLTTQITSDLKSKLSYRYYDFDNNTPEIRFPQWVGGDANVVAAGAGNYWNVSSISPGYTKQNGSAELNWRPMQPVNVGVVYNYERFDWTRTDVNYTTENSGKIYIDYIAANGNVARASYQHAERNPGNYDYLNYVGLFQWPNCTQCRYSSAYRQFMFDDRVRDKGDFQISFQLAPGLSITPTLAMMNDSFRLAGNEFGLRNSQSYHAGAELAWLVNPDTTVMLAYMYDAYSQDIRQTSTVYTSVEDRINTIMLAVNYAAIPNTLDLKFNYTLSRSTDKQPLSNLTTAQFTPVTGLFQRFDATALYKFDEDFVRRMGWNGRVTAKLRYSWERNAVANWNDDMMSSYMYTTATGTGYMTWMAYNNPNYNVHMIAASLGFAW